MSIAGTIDAPLDLFGGLVTDMPASDLPQGVSPDCQDVVFQSGSVKTRPGLVSLFASPLAGNPTINYLKSYTFADLTEALLLLDSQGKLWSSAASGAPTQINTGAQQSIFAGSFGKSITQFFREYIALGDGKFGIDLPRQYDGTNFDRVSQSGPGASPTGADCLYQLTALSRTSGIITGTVNVAPSVCEIIVGGTVTIAGVNADATFNGTWPVLTVSGTATTTFTAWGNPAFVAVSTLNRAANVVTAVLETPPVFNVGDTVILAEAEPGSQALSFNGSFVVTSISGNNVTWAQTGPNDNTISGILYSATPTFAVIQCTSEPNANIPTLLVQVQGNASAIPIGANATIANNSKAYFNSTWQVTAAPIYTPTPAPPPTPETVTLFGSQITVSTGAIFPPNSTIIYIDVVSGNGIGQGGTLISNLPDSSPAVTGVAGPGGSITPGLHQVSFIFQTRQGYLTKPSPPTSWTSLGGCVAQFTNIPLPTAPSNVVAGYVLLTAAAGGSFYYQAQKMQITDTSVSTWRVDISDSDLLAATLADPLFRQVVLGECSGVIGYASRLFWWGERNNISNLINLDFDGGFAGSGCPLGWTPDPTNFTGGGENSTGQAVWGGAYQILGDGLTAERGLIRQSAQLDYLGVPILQPGTGYSVRARICKTGSIRSGIVHVNLYSPTLGGIVATGISLGASATPATMTEFIAALTPAAGLASIPSDLVLQVYADGTPSNGAGWVIDCIEVFPTNQPYNGEQMRGSFVDNPEAFDGISGLLTPTTTNGKPIRSSFVLTDRSSLVASDHLHMVTDTCIYRASDTTEQEPADWSITQVSGTIGTPSVNGCDVGEDWAVIAHSSGLYLYVFGSEPTKISQEIQPLWDSVNWAAGASVWVRVDTKNKRILVGVPMGSATMPNAIIVLDYRGLVNSSQIIGTPPVYFSSYTGKMITLGLGRRWTVWNITANCAWFEPPSTALQIPAPASGSMFLGNAAPTQLPDETPGNGKVYYLSDTATNDDGAAINSYYTTYFFLSNELEQSYQVRSHRKLFAYLSMYAEGAGNLNLSAFVDNEAYPTALTPLPLSSPSPKDLELPINLLGERVAFQVGTNLPGAWFRLEKFTPSLLPDPWAPVRGGN